MARLYDVITFDCYGTLIDWEGGISTAFASALPQMLGNSTGHRC